MKKLLTLFGMMLLLVSYVAAQKTVSGTVTDESGVPLVGANVLAKGTITGTVTDLEGNYNFTVAEDVTTLVVSYTGFETTEVDAAVGQTVILYEGINLQEAVVTALGIEKSRDAVGFAVTSLSEEQVQQKNEPDPVRALQGKVAGVNIIGSGGAVAGGTNITIRGNSSLLGNNQPLFVVDGIPFDNTSFETGSFTSATTATSRSFDIDPNNIESINILKGAAAAAVYGSRGANGVIVITTKSGRGRSQKGLEVSVNSSYSLEDIANLPDYQMRYANGNNFLLVNGNFGTWGASFDINDPEWQVADNANLLTDAEGNPYTSGQPYMLHPYNNTAEGRAVLSDVYVPFKATNNAEEFFQTGFVLENSVSISGGDQKANFIAGFSRLENEGIVPENQVERIGFNAGGNVQLDNGFFVSGSINFVRSELSGPPTSGLFTGNASVTERILYLPPSLDLANSPIEDPITGQQLFYRTDNDNPYYLTQYSQNTSDVNRTFGSLKVGYDIRPWLTVEYQYGQNQYTDRRLNVLPLSTREIPQGRLTTDDISYREIDGTALIRFSRPIFNKLGLQGNVGHNINERLINRTSFQGQGIIAPRIYNLNNTSSVIPNGGGKTLRRYHAVFADLTLKYDDWAYLNLVGRNEWNSGLPSDDRSFFFGGANLSMVLSEALDLQSGLLNYAKIRLGFAQVGNDIPAYLTNTVFLANSGIGNNTARINYPINTINSISQSSGLGNPTLKPEITTEYEAGAELSFLQGRITVDAAYYHRSSKDQIVPISVAPSSGFNTLVANVGEIVNQGVEVALGITPVRLANGFEWTTNIAFTRNRNTVEELTNDLDQIFIAGFGNSVQSIHKKREPFGQIFGSTAARHTDGRLLVDQSTGKLVQNLEFDVIGDPNPDFTMGVNTAVTFKGFSLSALFDWRKGGDVWSASFNQLFGRGVTTQTIPNHPDGRRVTLVIPGLEADPNNLFAARLVDGEPVVNGTQLTTNDWWFINTFGSAGPHEFSVFDASTIRLREVSLSYRLPSTLLDKTPFGSATLSVSGRNLWFLAYNMPTSLNFDPEVSSLGSGNVNSLAGAGATNGSAQGIDFGGIPTTKRYGVNLSFTF